MRISALAGFILIFSVVSVHAEPNTIFDMDTAVHVPNEITHDGRKVPCGTADVVDGKFGKAVRFTFINDNRGGFMTARIRPTDAWDVAAGFSFWVKGDGSTHCGGIELIDRDDFALRYAYCFPIESTVWQKITVRWSDLTPELKAPLVDPSHGYKPSHFGNFWFGKWFYWRDCAAISYAIDQVQLEPTIDAPAALPAAGAPLARLREKLRRHDPVTIVTMGDSLSDKRHWSNQKILWSELLAADLKSQFGSDVKLINPAVGGTTLSQNLVTMPTWHSQAPEPDLVTVWFGGNDWETGVRGERFAEYLRLAMARIRRQTAGHADILLMTTCPSYAHWGTMREMERAVSEVGRELDVPVVDVAADFRSAGSADAALAKDYWAWDKTHLGAAGHHVVEQAVMRVIDGVR